MRSPHGGLVSLDTLTNNRMESIMPTRKVNGTEYRVNGNRHARPLISWYELPTGERDNFDYVEESERYDTRFFQYRGEYYDYYEFERAGDDVRALGYDGVQSQSYFSAVVVSYFDRDGHELSGEIIAGYIHW